MLQWTHGSPLDSDIIALFTVLARTCVAVRPKLSLEHGARLGDGGINMHGDVLGRHASLLNEPGSVPQPAIAEHICRALTTALFTEPAQAQKRKQYAVVIPCQ